MTIVISSSTSVKPSLPASAELAETDVLVRAASERPTVAGVATAARASELGM